MENFRQSGTSHLLAISGLHLGILLLMTVGVLHWALGRHTPIPVLLALVAVWLYVLVSGAPVSVVRAAIMGSVYLAALGLGRPRESLLPALALSVVVMTALDSRAASRISFQLSFAAMAGIALALPWQDTLSRSIAGRVEQTGWRWSPLAGDCPGVAGVGCADFGGGDAGNLSPGGPELWAAAPAGHTGHHPGHAPAPPLPWPAD